MIVEIGLDSYAPLDWSCVAYPHASSMRSGRFQTEMAAGRFTDPSPDRQALAQALYREAKGQHVAGAAPLTLLTRYRVFRVFVGYADRAGFSISFESLIETFTKWTRSLAERHALGQIGEHTQYGLVTKVGKQIADVLGCPLTEVMVGVRLKKPKRATKRSRDKQNLEVTQQFVSDIIDIIGSLNDEALKRGAPFPVRLGGVEIASLGSPTTLGQSSRRRILRALNVRMGAEFSLFIAATGMNRAEATQLELTDFRYHSFEDRIEVRAFKGRADAGIAFSLVPGYRKYFDAFCEFRQNFYRNVGSTKLFVTLGTAYEANQNTVNTQPLACLLNAAGRRWVPPSILRKTKANVITRFASISDAARELQNTEAVLNRNYLYPAHQQAVVEMGVYFRYLAEEGRSREAVGPGRCIGQTAPAPQPSVGAIPLVDCRSPAGCLFCLYNRGQRSFDYVWNLATFNELKRTELARYRQKEGLPLHGQLAATLERIQEIFSTMSGDDQLARWLKEATELITSGEHHPRWSHWITLAGI